MSRNKFISDLLNGSLSGSSEGIRHEALLFDIDLCVPRVVVAIDIGRSSLVCWRGGAPAGARCRV